jgi:hypothetical protein
MSKGWQFCTPEEGRAMGERRDALPDRERELVLLICGGLGRYASAVEVTDALLAVDELERDYPESGYLGKCPEYRALLELQRRYLAEIHLIKWQFAPS